MSDHQHHEHEHAAHVHMDEPEMIDAIEREGRVFAAFVTGTADRVDGFRSGASMRNVLDVGSGPGASAFVLAERFPEARIVAADGSPTMVGRAEQRIAERGLGERIVTRLVELPHGVPALVGELGPFDLIWASMVLHHVGDEQQTLRALGQALAPDGILAIAEFGDAPQPLPDDIGIGRPGLLARIEAAGMGWVAEMRATLPESTVSADYPTMFASAGLQVLDDRIGRVVIDGPPTLEGRRVVHANLLRASKQFRSRLDAEDLATLDVLLDEDDHRGVMHRRDLVVDGSRQIVIARRAGAPS
ncbi:MAG: hypothetical protein JWN62_3906 [Acidimicrobiales bacterium]|nr:hypothetical protein [Acidimicrobiales bacterium]